MTRAHIEGGIPGVWRRYANYNDPYPVQTLEFNSDGCPLTVELVRGHVVKLLEQRPVEELPAGLDNVHVAYMVRDDIARRRAHPNGHTMPLDSIDHLRHIKAITQDPRVAKLVVIDFDDMIDHPVDTMCLLVDHGWEFDYWKAAKAIDPSQRHAAKT